MNDLNSRIRQLTKLILTSQTVDDPAGEASRPASPSKLDFNLEPYQVSPIYTTFSTSTDIPPPPAPTRTPLRPAPTRLPSNPNPLPRSRPPRPARAPRRRPRRREGPPHRRAEAEHPRAGDRGEGVRGKFGGAAEEGEGR